MITRENKNYEGDKKSFDNSWKAQPEANYTHWVRGEPLNQIQLAFKNHWEVFQLLIKSKMFNQGKRVLEVGSGRGTMSCYFSDAGYECFLLDSSAAVINIAKKIFRDNNLKAEFEVGDALALPYENASFDIVFSIGLLEHFNNVQDVLAEQVRVLNKRGLLIAYIVPDWQCQVQTEHNWINEIITSYSKPAKVVEKPSIYRTKYKSKTYLDALKTLKLNDIHSSGIYSLPMISHSPDFPFSLMPPDGEIAFVNQCKKWLATRTGKGLIHPWICEEGFGQSLLVWGYK